MTTVRLMELDDLEQVLALEEANFTVPWTANGFFTFLIREDALFLVAEEDGTIQGYCGVILIPPEGDITNICVGQDFRHKGIARQLLLHLKQELKGRGIDTLHLEVRKSNLPAICLYETSGFKQDGIRPGYYESPSEDALLMTSSF